MIAEKNYIHVYIFLNGNWIFVYSIVHQFHRNIKDIIFNKGQIWILLNSGEVYLGSIIGGSISSALAMAKHFPWNQVTINSSTKLATANWAHLINVKASRIVLDRQRSQLYFLNPSTKWIYRWIPSSSQSDIYGNSFENVIHGYSALVQQSSVIDFVVDSARNSIVWIGSYPNNLAAIFMKPLDDDREIVLIRSINCTTDIKIKFLIQDSERPDYFYFSTESTHLSQNDSLQVENMTSYLNTFKIEKNPAASFKIDSINSAVCDTGTSWFMESKPSVLGVADVSIQLLANHRLIWSSLRWNTSFKLFGEDKYSHNDVDAYSLELRLKHESLLNPVFSLYASYDFELHQSAIDFLICWSSNSSTKRLIGTFINGTLIAGRYEIKTKLKVINSMTNRVCAVQSFHRSNDVIQKYISTPSILRPDLCLCIDLLGKTICSCMLDDRLLDLCWVNRKTDIMQAILKVIFSWKEDFADSTGKVVRNEEIHNTSFVTVPGLSIYSRDFMFRVYLVADDDCKISSDTVTSNLKLYYEKMTKSSPLTSGNKMIQKRHLLNTEKTCSEIVEKPFVAKLLFLTPIFIY
ncbi:unnamed protein product [Heterobilharzia americana]|nr:unnamed protein product [Heterobilharzia americana]